MKAQNYFPTMINQTGPNRIITNTVIDINAPLTIDSGIVKILQLAMHYGQQPKKQEVSQGNRARWMRRRNAQAGLLDDNSNHSLIMRTNHSQTPFP
jgi:hypothetical protein